MADKKAVGAVVGLSVLLTGLVVVPSWFRSTSSLAEIEPLEPVPVAAPSPAAGGDSQGPGRCGSMLVGNLQGQVNYDKEKDYHFLQMRGARFPFKASPLDAQNVPLEAPGQTERDRNSALITRVLGPQVQHATILVNPDEEKEVMPAAADLALYLRVVNPRKFSGLAYTKEGGKLQDSVAIGSQVQSAREATDKTPKILLKGPKSGASKTRVAVAGDGTVAVEGTSYEDLYKAADMICLTLLKMLCGSPDCPDAAACATGGACGCG